MSANPLSAWWDSPVANHFSRESFDRYKKYYGKAMIESSDGSLKVFNEERLNARLEELKTAESQPVSTPGVSDEEIRTILLGGLDMWSKRSPEIAKRVAQVLIDALKEQYEL